MKTIYITEIIRRGFEWDALEEALAEELCHAINYEEVASEIAASLIEEVQTAAREIANEANYL